VSTGYEFDEAIALDDDENHVVFPERWTMGPGFAHGGYLMSVALGHDDRALRAPGQGR